MALEDAVVLAKSLRDTPDTDTGLALYEALRRPRVEHNTVVSGSLSRGGRGSTVPRPREEDLPGSSTGTPRCPCDRQIQPSRDFMNPSKSSR